MRLGRGHVLGGGLTAEQRVVLQRLERGELTAAEAERLLVNRTAEPVGAERIEPESARQDETPEEAAARALVERIAQEVDAERR